MNFDNWSLLPGCSVHLSDSAVPMLTDFRIRTEFLAPPIQRLQSAVKLNLREDYQMSSQNYMQTPLCGLRINNAICNSNKKLFGRTAH